VNNEELEKAADIFAGGRDGNHDKSWTYEMLEKGFLAGAKYQAAKDAEMIGKLKIALERIRDHFIPFDRAPSMATQNHYLKDLAREALKETSGEEE